jgi:RNA polymerase sigma-70 factor (ECF subfamily)
MSAGAPSQVTELLMRWSGGDRSALDELMPLVLEELKRLASRYMHSERTGHTLQTTALVNEAFLKLADEKRVSWQGRAHFFAIASQVMRHVLVDHARTRRRAKRGGGAERIPLEQALAFSDSQSADLLALDEALTKLATIDPRKSAVIEMRFFSGMSVEETAAVLGVSTNTVIRDWGLARSWLYRELQGLGSENVS